MALGGLTTAKSKGEIGTEERQFNLHSNEANQRQPVVRKGNSLWLAPQSTEAFALTVPIKVNQICSAHCAVARMNFYFAACKVNESGKVHRTRQEDNQRQIKLPDRLLLFNRLMAIRVHAPMAIMRQTDCPFTMHRTRVATGPCRRASSCLVDAHIHTWQMNQRARCV